MKFRILFLCCLCINISILIGQGSPQAFKYQAVARDINGVEIKNKTINFRISILQGSTVGVSVYTETHTITTNDFGVANLTIGDGTVVSGVFANINWGANSHFLKVEMDANAGTNFQLMGTSQLLSVPYALYAGQTGNIKLKTGPGIGFNKDSIWNTSMAGALKLKAGPGIGVLGDSIFSKYPAPNNYSAGTGISITGSAPNYTINTTGGGGGSSFSDTFWRFNSAGKAFTYGYLGVNRTPTTRRLDAGGITSDAAPSIGRFRTFPTTSSTNVSQAALMGFTTGGSSNYFLYGVFGSCTAPNSGNSGFNIGIGGSSDSGSLVCRGVSGGANGKVTSYNQAVFGRADGSNSIADNLGIYGYSLNSTNNNIGVMGAADQATGNNYGVYGRAINGGSNNAGYFEGDLTYTGSLNGPSDLKLKENIKPLTGAIDRVYQLIPKTYTFTNQGIYGQIGFPKGLQFGLIAQDVEKVFPNLVKNNRGFILSKNSNATDGSQLDSNSSNTTQNYEFKSVNYMGLIPVLIQAIKDQQDAITELKRQNELMQKEIEVLKK